MLPLFAIAGHYFASNILLYAIYHLFVNVFHTPVNKFAEFSGWTEFFINILLFFIFLLIYRLIFGKEINETRGVPNLRISVISLAAGAGVYGVSSLWIMIAKNLPSLQKSLSAMEAANRTIENGSNLELLLVTVVAAPLIEEILFRGIVFRSMRKVFPGWISIILSAVMFGAYHMNMIQAVYAAFMGIVAAIIYDKTNHLIYPVLVHAANNFIGVILTLF